MFSSCFSFGQELLSFRLFILKLILLDLLKVFCCIVPDVPTFWLHYVFYGKLVILELLWFNDVVLSNMRDWHDFEIRLSFHSEMLVGCFRHFETIVFRKHDGWNISKNNCARAVAVLSDEKKRFWVWEMRLNISLSLESIKNELARTSVRIYARNS